MDSILTGAVDVRASDIHIEPQEPDMRQAVKVPTDLAVKAKRDPAFSQHHDLFESTYQKFNEFAITVSVGIALVEEAGGDFHTRNGRCDLYFHEYSICRL